MKLDPIKIIEEFCLNHSIYMTPFYVETMWLFLKYIPNEDGTLERKCIGIDYEYLVKRPDDILKILETF